MIGIWDSPPFRGPAPNPPLPCLSLTLFTTPFPSSPNRGSSPAAKAAAFIACLVVCVFHLIPHALQTVTGSPSTSALRHNDVFDVLQIWQLFVGSAILPFLDLGNLGLGGVGLGKWLVGIAGIAGDEKEWEREAEALDDEAVRRAAAGEDDDGG